MELKIKKVVIISRQCHPDIVYFDIENLTSGYPSCLEGGEEPIANLKMECARGTAEHWCKLNNFVVDEIIHV